MPAASLLINQSSIAVLLLIGGYPSEVYSSERIGWLEQSLQDLSDQSLKPSEILVSLNSSVSSNKHVINLVKSYLPDSKILSFSLNRSGALNFETLLALSNSEYVCFWSDHDVHSSQFLRECLDHMQDNSAVLCCPLINYIYETGEPYLPKPQSLQPLNTSTLSKRESLAKAMSSDILGSIYGIWSKKVFEIINIYGHESIDILAVYAASLLGNIVFFESQCSSLVLRHKVAKVNNHNSLLPSEIMNPSEYMVTRHSRFLKILKKVIIESSDNENSSSHLLCTVRNVLSTNKNCYGLRYPGVRFLLKSFVLCLKCRISLGTFILHLIYFASHKI